MGSHTVTGKVASCSKFTDVLYKPSSRLMGISFIFFLIFFVKWPKLRLGGDILLLQNSQDLSIEAST